MSPKRTLTGGDFGFGMGNAKSAPGEPPMTAEQHGFRPGDRVQTQYTVEEGGDDSWCVIHHGPSPARSGPATCHGSSWNRKKPNFDIACCRYAGTVKKVQADVCAPTRHFGSGFSHLALI